LKFVRKLKKIFTAEGAQPVLSTPGANGKNLQSEKFLSILFGHLWVVELTYINNFFPSTSL
jgi:hypothetical protein